MARHFFTGGIMPSEDFPRQFNSHLEVERQWRVDGLHYSRTLEAWLQGMDRNRERLMPLFSQTYGEEAERWFARWRMFFMACSELFRYRAVANEWFVAHTFCGLERFPAGDLWDDESGVCRRCASLARSGGGMAEENR